MTVHPSLILFYGFLMFSVFLVVSADSWFMVWMGLEMNVMAFVPLILVKNNKYSSEAGIKYFLVQAFASVMIMSGVLLKSCNWGLSEHLLTGGILLKMGAAPFHQWLPSLVEGASWGCLMILFIIQKISPLIVLSFLLKSSTYYALIYSVIVCSSLVGSVGGLMTPSLRKIMAYSSISHLGWAISSMLVSNFVWMGYYFFYGIVVFSVLSLFNKEEAFSLNKLVLSDKKIRVLMGMGLLSLAGLPPFSGFVPKFLVSMSLLQYETYFIFVVLLSSTFLSLFFYMRMVLNSLILSSGANSLTWTEHSALKGVWFNMAGLLAPSAVFFALLNFKLF